MNAPTPAMKRAGAAAVAAAVALALAAGSGAAAPEKGVSSGPDVIIGELTGPGAGPKRWGEVGGVTGYSVGTTACNVGDEVLPWDADTNDHPVIAQNLYRLEDDRFEQVGMSWIKHGFAAQTGGLCDTCQDPFDSQVLGVGCSDVYTADLNGRQETFGFDGGLGPRFEVDAASGFFPYPYTDRGETGDAIYKRLQVHNADLDPAQHPGARYFIEGHYVTAADAAAGNDANNASYREVAVSAGPPFALTFAGATEREKPAILAWQDVDPQVEVDHVDVADDGRFTLAAKAIDLGGGQWRYEYALFNLSSARGAGSFTVPFSPGVTVSATGFSDVDYHSGEPWDGTDWLASVDAMAGTAGWSTRPASEDPEANALRWSTLYNFWLEADSPPGAGQVTIGLFEPGSPAVVTVSTVAPVAIVFTDGFESGDVAAWTSSGP